MNKYEFDTERWLRSNAEFYSRNGNLMVARNLELAADDFAALRLRAEQSEERCKRMEESLDIIQSGFEFRTAAPKMDGTFEKHPHLLDRKRMMEIARKALEDK